MTLYLLLLIVLLVFFLLIQKKPDFWFWLFLMLFFDPGGFFHGYFDSKAVGPLNFSDLFFFGILAAINIVSRQSRILSQDAGFKRMFYYLLFFQIYYVVFYGLLVPYYNNRLDFFFFLQKNRAYFMVLPIMYGVYLFTQRSINLFFKMLVYFAITILTLYMITLLTKIPIIPTLTMERYTGTGIERIAMLSYGLIDLIFPIAIILFLLDRFKRINIKNKKGIYFSAMLMLITYFLTLTRREYLSIVLSIILIILSISYVFRVSKFKLSRKIIIPALLGFLLLFALFPKSLDNTLTLFQDTFSLVLTGKDTSGQTDYRISGTDDMLYVKQIISENPVMGTGYIPYIWADIVELKKYGDTFAMAMDASAEVPIYGAFFRLGIVGVLLASGVYILLLKDLFKFLKGIKKRSVLLNRLSNVESILIFLSIYHLLSIFTIRVYGLFGDFYNPSTIPVFAVMLGLFYSLKKKWENLNREF